MSPRARVCSECPNTLAGTAPQTKTCSQRCRGIRSRRLRTQRIDAGRANALPPERAELGQLVRGEKDDIAQRVVEDELRPVVREAITEEVLRGIQDLVGLTPTVVAAIQEDLGSYDSTVRQRAYSLALQYTLGNAAVAPKDGNTGKALNVYIATPRPDIEADTTAVEIPEMAAPEGSRECDMCGEIKGADKFVSDSDRCVACWEDQKKKVEERFGGG